jgi:hypothetical protein
LTKSSNKIYLSLFALPIMVGLFYLLIFLKR